MPDPGALLAAAELGPAPDHALISQLALDQPRILEATGIGLLSRRTTKQAAGAERPQRGAAQQLRLEAVSPDIGELVMTADVIIVTVSGDGDDRLAGQISELASHAAQSHPGVHDQVMVPSPDVPDVAAHQRDDMRLDQQGRGVIDSCPVEPAVSNRQRRHGYHPSTQPPHDSRHL